MEIQMNKQTLFVCAYILISSGILNASELTTKQQLGSAIFFDKSLSLNSNQGCVDCHSPSTGWTGDIAKFNEHGAAYQGSIRIRFGNRKPPSVAYATNSPVLHYDKKEALFLGGNFWDGRATGEKLGNPAADQAQGPFINPVEHALPEKACVVYKVCKANYPVKLDKEWPGSCDINWPTDVIISACKTEGAVIALPTTERAKIDKAYDYIGLAIAAFENSPAVNAFTSKYDYYLAGKVQLTKRELRGMKLFKDKGKCAACHPMESNSNAEPPLFTDYSYDNLGIPRNPENPW